MVNKGSRSKCCFACRERRVKCDLQKPHCQRCTQRKRPCPGYPDSWDTALRSQNEYAELRVQTRIEQARRLRLAQHERKVATIPRVQIAPEVHSWNRFYMDYVAKSGMAVFNVLPNFYVNCSAPCFQECLNAVAVASAARQLCQPGLMARASDHHRQAISSLNVALQNLALCTDDSVLLTLFLLSLYETIHPESFGTPSLDPDFHCHIHFRGALTLLRYRHEQGQDTEVDKSVFIFFSFICLMSNFNKYEPCQNKWSALATFAADWVDGPLLEPVLDRAVKFKQRFRALTSAWGDDTSSAEILQTIEEGAKVKQDLDNVIASIDSTGNDFEPPGQKQTSFNNFLEICSQTTEAIARNLYRAIQHNIVECLVDLLSLTDYEIDTTASDLTSIQLEIYQEISILLSFDNGAGLQHDGSGLGSRAFGMFWSLVPLLFSSSAANTRDWAIESLRFIGGTTGFGLATWAAEVAST